MPELFDMQRPLAVNFKNGDKTIMVAYYPHANGLVFLEPFWENKPADSKARVIEGEVRGDGPWRCGDASITLVGCQGTDADLAQLLSQWEAHVQNVGPEYYNVEDIRSLARSFGAII